MAHVARSPEQQGDRETVLFAVVGISPAVLTETVWALSRENPPLIPDRVVVVTTRRGAERVRRELLAPSPTFGGRSVWDCLRAAVCGRNRESHARLRLADTDDHLVLFSRYDARTGRMHIPEDIRTGEDNHALADCILERVRSFTDNPDVRLVASVAGGRKTMGILLYAAMSLVGREIDRVCHVLVREPYEDPDLTPRFYFPEQPSGPLYHARTKKRYCPKRACVDLVDVPFVPLRNRFRQCGDWPGSFNRLVARYAQAFQRTTAQPARVRLEATAHAVVVNGTRVVLTKRSFSALRFLIWLQQKKAFHSRQKDAVDTFKRFLASEYPGGQETAWCNDPDVLKRELSVLRRHFQKAGLTWYPGLRSESLRLPPFRIVK